jgi:hypothetical protein
MALFAAAALLALCVVSQQPTGAVAQSSSRRRSSGQTRCPDHAHERVSDYTSDEYEYRYEVLSAVNGEQCVCDCGYVGNGYAIESCVLDSTQNGPAGGSFNGDIGCTSCVFTGYNCPQGLDHPHGTGSFNYDTYVCTTYLSDAGAPADSACWEGRCYEPSSCLPGEASAADRQMQQDFQQDIERRRASSAQRTLLMWALGVAVGLAAAAIICGPGGRGASTGAAVGVVLPSGTAVHGMMHISHIDNSCCGDQTSGCAWYTDAETCLLALFCPCVLYGLNRERAGLARFCCGDCALFALLPTIMWFVMIVVIFYGHDVVTVSDIGIEGTAYRLAIEFVVVMFTPSMVLGGLQARNRTQLRMVTQGRNPTGWRAGLCGSADSVFLYIGSYVVNTLLPFIYIPPLMFCLVACASAQVRGLPIRPIRPIVRSRASLVLRCARMRFVTVTPRGVVMTYIDIVCTA